MKPWFEDHVRWDAGLISRWREGQMNFSQPFQTALVAVVMVASTLVLSACARASVTSSTKLTSAGICVEHAVDGVIPSWARAGFSESEPRMHYEIATQGGIVALLWAYPLLAPPPSTHNNKILWVSRVSTDGSPLLISAQRMIGAEPVGRAVHRRVTGGPGPSIIDLPQAGCWRFDLHWSAHSDQLDLSYFANSTS